MRSLPGSATREEIRHALPDFRPELDALFANHATPAQGYPIRDIAVFGLAEAERAIAFIDACREGDFDEILRLARLSQDGDRMTKSIPQDGSWTTNAFRFRLSDDMLDGFVQRLDDNPNAREAQIRYLPGRFERSTLEMDQLADVVDAHLSSVAAIRVMGAGKGGNMHAIVKEDRVDEFISIIQEKYFREIAGIQEPTMMLLGDPGQGAEVLGA